MLDESTASTRKFVSMIPICQPCREDQTAANKSSTVFE